MLLPRNVQDLRRLRPVPALLPTHQLLQENGHQNEVGQCQKYGLSWAEGGLASDSVAQLQRSATSTYWNSATFPKFPGLQDSLTGLLSSVQQQAIQNQVRQLGPDPAGFPKLRQLAVQKNLPDNDFDNSSEMGL